MRRDFGRRRDESTRRSAEGHPREGGSSPIQCDVRRWRSCKPLQWLCACSRLLATRKRHVPPRRSGVPVLELRPLPASARPADPPATREVQSPEVTSSSGISSGGSQRTFPSCHSGTALPTRLWCRSASLTALASAFSTSFASWTSSSGDPILSGWPRKYPYAPRAQRRYASIHSAPFGGGDGNGRSRIETAWRSLPRRQMATISSAGVMSSRSTVTETPSTSVSNGSSRASCSTVRKAVRCSEWP